MCPKDHIEIRILQTVVSAIPGVLALEPGCTILVDVVFGALQKEKDDAAKRNSTQHHGRCELVTCQFTKTTEGNYFSYSILLVLKI